jgi:hypothetical protein
MMFYFHNLFLFRSSSIFDGSEKVRRTTQEEESVARDLNDQIDLTVMQDKNAEDNFTEIDNELDILEAHVDPLDVKTLRKKYKLQSEIEIEKTKMKCKFLFKYGRQEHDPFKLWS